MTGTPGLVEWPARINSPRASNVLAHTSDLLPTLCALTGQPLPERPLDGIDLTPVLDGTMAARPAPIFFWDYNIARLTVVKASPYIDPEQQKGTTPLVKLAGGKATRDFNNLRHPGDITDADLLGARAIIEGRFKLVIHDGKKSATPNIELFDLESDPGEKTSLTGRQPGRVRQLQAKLHNWQQSVLKSLIGADYARNPK